jgi:hypothetical protein
LLYTYFKVVKKGTKKNKESSLLEGLLKVSFYFIPVDHIPPSCHIVCPAVLVLKIIGMFPYVKT